MRAHTSDRGLRIALLGGVPPALGGGGLELQMERTAAALRDRGHEVEHVERLEAGATFDVLHAFGSEANVWFAVRHWRHSAAAPLVLTPVIVTSPGRVERRLVLGAALPGVMTTARMKRELLVRADVVVCLTAHERGLVQRLGRRGGRTEVIGNGADPVAEDQLPDAPSELPDQPFALLLGAVSERKRQTDILAALGTRLAAVVVGGWAGEPGRREPFEREVGRSGGLWLGEIGDPATIQAIQRIALAQVLLSTAETQSLAVLEALAVGLPVVVSDIPSHRELKARHPDLVHVVDSPEDAVGALLSLRGSPRPSPAAIATWDDVAAQLEKVYGDVLSARSRPTAKGDEPA